jgi:hypothetical protein
MCINSTSTNLQRMHRLVQWSNRYCAIQIHLKQYQYVSLTKVGVGDISSLHMGHLVRLHGGRHNPSISSDVTHILCHHLSHSKVTSLSFIVRRCMYSSLRDMNV